MKFDHMIKLNGIYYAAGEDVPMEEKKDAPEIEIPELQVDDEPKRRGKKPKAV